MSLTRFELFALFGEQLECSNGQRGALEFSLIRQLSTFGFGGSRGVRGL